MKRLVKLLVKIAPLYFLIASVSEMGWNIAVEDSEMVEGLTIGTNDYIDRHIPKAVAPL